METWKLSEELLFYEMSLFITLIPSLVTFEWKVKNFYYFRLSGSASHSLWQFLTIIWTEIFNWWDQSCYWWNPEVNSEAAWSQCQLSNSGQWGNEWGRRTIWNLLLMLICMCNQLITDEVKQEKLHFES